jgi:hypothetical protein
LGINNSKLIIFDTPSWERDEKVYSFTKVKRAIWKRMIEMRLFIKYPSYFIQNKKEALQRKLERNFNIKVENEDQISELKKIIKRLSFNNEIMMNSYLLTPIDQKIFLFKVEVPNFFVDDMAFYGWKNLVSIIEVINLPGHHNNIFKNEKTLGIFATKLQNVLDSDI